MNNELSKEILSFESDHIWVYENFNELFNKYPEQWIAVKNHNVIASDNDLLRLIDKLSDPSNTCIDFLTKEHLEMIL